MRGAVVAVVIAAAACHRSPASATPPVASAPASLLASVPADTPYVVNVDRQWFAFARAFGKEQATTKLREALQEIILTPEAEATATPAARVLSDLARDVATFDEHVLVRYGWLPGESTAVLYGLGIVPVVRARLDGVVARQALIDALVRVGVTFTDARRGGVPYLVVPLPGDKPALVIAFHPRQVAASLGHDPEVILPHLLQELASPSLAETWQAQLGDRLAPASSFLTFQLDPAAVAARLRDPADLIQLGAKPADRSPACLGAIADLMDHLPRISNASWVQDDTLITDYTAHLTPSFRRLFASGGPIPHWLDKPVAMELGVGIAPARALPLVRELALLYQGASRACDHSDSPMPDLDIGPVTLVTSGTYVATVTGTTVAMALVVDVTDVNQAWRWLGKQIPLGALPPPGEVRTLPLPSGDQLHVVASRQAIAASIGWDEAQLRALLASPGRPELVYLSVDGVAVAEARAHQLTFAGQPFELGDFGMATTLSWEVVLDEDVLVIRNRAALGSLR